MSKAKSPRKQPKPAPKPVKASNPSPVALNSTGIEAAAAAAVGGTVNNDGGAW